MPLYDYLIAAAVAVLVAGGINRLFGRVVLSALDLLGLAVCYALYQSAPANSLLALKVGGAFLTAGLLVELINKTLTPGSQRDPWLSLLDRRNGHGKTGLFQR